MSTARWKPRSPTEVHAPGRDGGNRLRALWPGGGVVAIWLVAVASSLGQWMLLAAPWPSESANFLSGLVAIALTSVGAMVVLRGDSRRYGWVMLWMGVALAGIGFASLSSLRSVEVGSLVSPAAVWFQDLWMLPQVLGFLLVPALFPDGTPASPRWRVAVGLAAASWTVLIGLFVLADRGATNVFLGHADAPSNPTGFLPIPMAVFDVAWAVLLLASVVIGIGSLITRWRRADAEFRQKMKWLLYALGLLLTTVALNLANTVLMEEGVDLGLTTVLGMLSLAALLSLVVALGFAVLRFRLYDVDWVINRTVVYGILAVVIGAAYVGVIVGVGEVLPVRQTPLALLAAGLVAVAFASLRDRVQKWVNQLMFGRRDDPYSVLTEMGRLMAETGTPEETLQTLTEIVATSLKLPGAAIELQHDGGWITSASFGKPVDEQGVVVVPLRHQGEQVGRLLALPRSLHDPITSRDSELLQNIAHPAGAIADSVRLTMELQRSRERLVLAREEERRRIRRDLHDGLGPSLASQTFQLDEILERLGDDPAAAADLVIALKEQNRHLVTDIRRLVYELRPPTLDELGVAGALAAHAAQVAPSGSPSIEVVTVPDPLPALPAALEVAAYRITREAITNIVRHARATRCTAILEAMADRLTISVRDDGTGLTPSARTGVGLIAMRERSEELGGTLEIVSPDMGGTEVVATIPLMNGTNRRTSE